MMKLLGQYALAGLLGVIGRAGGLVADDLSLHIPVDWDVVLGESIKTVLPLLTTLAIVMHLPDIGTKSSRPEPPQPRLNLRGRPADPDPPGAS